MKTSIRALILAVALGTLAAGHAHAQRPAEQPKRAPEQNPSSGDVFVPLKVQVVVSTYEGQKKLRSLPYELSVFANAPEPARLRLMEDVPIPTGKSPDSGGSFAYKNVGTAIDCKAMSNPDGRFELSVSVTDTAVVPRPPDARDNFSDVPRFRSFTTSNTVLLKDGQTTQLNAAADPISGQITRVEVTLTVMK